MPTAHRVSFSSLTLESVEIRTETLGASRWVVLADGRKTAERSKSHQFFMNRDAGLKVLVRHIENRIAALEDSLGYARRALVAAREQQVIAPAAQVLSSSSIHPGANAAAEQFRAGMPNPLSDQSALS